MWDNADMPDRAYAVWRVGLIYGKMWCRYPPEYFKGNPQECGSANLVPLKLCCSIIDELGKRVLATSALSQL
jgi:hypothetical protein